MNSLEGNTPKSQEEEEQKIFGLVEHVTDMSTEKFLSCQSNLSSSISFPHRQTYQIHCKTLEELYAIKIENKSIWT